MGWGGRGRVGGYNIKKMKNVGCGEGVGGSEWI